MKIRFLSLATVVAASLAIVPACGDDTPEKDTGAGVTTTTGSVAPSIAGAWARNSPMQATNGAAYMEVTGGTTDDRIVAASVDKSVAAKVELHETVAAAMSSTTGGMMSSSTVAGGDEMTSSTLSPAMEMRPVESIAIPAGEKVALKPGGLHIMLIDLVKPLVIGESLDLTVTFATAGEQKVKVEVKEAP